MEKQHFKNMNTSSDLGIEDGFNFDAEEDFGEDRPWLNKYKSYSPGMKGLHEEIEDFYEIMKPTPGENEQRYRALRQVQQIASDQWSEVVVQAYGSFRTGLYLPTSDVDCMIAVKDLPESEVLSTLRKALISTKVAESAILIQNTRVPVLKFMEKSTSVMVDIVAHKHQGVETANLVQEWMKESPVIPRLFLVLKQFLQFHRLGNVYKGGLNSYSLIIMIVSFLRLKSKAFCVRANAGKRRKCKNKNKIFSNSGESLINFLEFFGQEFDYTKQAIKITNDSSPFVPKEDLYQLCDDLGSAILVIQDPLDESNNVSRGTFRAASVQEAFASAASKLKYPVRLFRSFFPDAGFLGRVVRVPSKVLDYRTKILQNQPLGEDLPSAASVHHFEDLSHENESAGCQISSCGHIQHCPSPCINFEWMRLFVAGEDG
ncbi:unnamed protein product [Allacma fusca]|uniref:Uncharacterized protein n=1 Tax=Allacma fusca TaxID=39272 RepID=A0A8J2P0W3_9HEXA|nr:unnamed protein product [Allacma fusca]